VLGLLLAFAAERFDRRVREPSDLENLYRAPLLAVVPQSSALKLSSDMPEAANRVLPADVAEVFGLLRAHIRYYNVDQQPRVVLVVSASPGDGKTTVARNLALVSGTVGARTLFVEADLRRPTAAKQFGVSPAPGLVDVLTNELPFKDVVQTVQVTQRGQRQDVVDVLTAGGVVPASPAQMLESHAMEHLLEQAKRTYDLVVVDTPPLVMLSDAFPLLRQADGVLIVSRLGQNRSDVAVRLREMLASSEAPVIGVVANGYKSAGGTSYGYGYTDAEYLNAPIVELAAAETSRNGAPDHPVSVPGANSEPPARGEPAGHAQDPNGPAPAGTARNGVGSTEAVGSVSGVSSVSGTSASAESAGNGWRPDEGNGRNGISGADPSQLLPDLQQPTAPQEPEGNRRRSGGIRGKLQQALRDRRS
jgi:capsular exopolysaccharide synthesis family protein